MEKQTQAEQPAEEPAYAVAIKDISMATSFFAERIHRRAGN